MNKLDSKCTTYDLSQTSIVSIKLEIEQKVTAIINDIAKFLNSDFDIYKYCNQDKLLLLIGITFDYRFENNRVYVDKYVSNNSQIKTTEIKSGCAVYEKMQESCTIVFDTEHNLERVDIVCVSIHDKILISAMLDEKIQLYSFAYMEMDSVELFKSEDTLLSLQEEIEFIKLKKLCNMNKEIRSLLPELYMDTVCDYSSEEFNNRLNYCKIFIY